MNPELKKTMEFSGDEERLLQRAEELRQKKLKEKNSRAAALVNGEIKPPNEMVSYLVQRIRATRREYEQVTQQIQQLNTQLQSLTQRQANLEGDHNSHVADLQFWDKDSTESLENPNVISMKLPDVEIPVP
jgi:hypothetical protein